MKKCPFCAEEIQSEAIKCRYCGEWLDKKLSGQGNRLPHEASKVEPPTVSTLKQRTVVAPLTEKPKESGKFWGGIQHPWRRLFARIVDISILGTLPLFVVTFSVIIFNAVEFAKVLKYPIVTWFIVPVLWIPIEAIFLSTIGNTPAKWLFGISVRTTSGRKLSFSQAFERSFRVFLQGMGLGIPIVTLFPQFFAYRRLTKTGTTLWDTATECAVIYKNWGATRVIGVVAVFLVLISLVTFSVAQFNAYRQRGYNAYTTAPLPASSHEIPPAPNLSDSAGWRPVEQSDARFIGCGDGTVLDTKMDLMWAAKDNVTNVDWKDAKSYCENYRGGGYTDWRMPTQDELAGLYDARKTQLNETSPTYPIHITELIDITSCCSWASETRGFEAASFNFNTGKREWERLYDPSSSAGSWYPLSTVLPVRSGK